MKNLLLKKVQLVLEALAGSGSVTLNELSTRLDIPLPTLSRLISDMAEMKLVEKIDYYRIAPAAGLIRMGECAKKNSYLVQTVAPILQEYSDRMQMNLILGGFDCDTMFNIFSCGMQIVPEDVIRESGLASVMMWKSGISPEKCREIFCASRIVSDTDILIFEREMEQISKDRMLFRSDTRRQWSCAVPFIYRNGVYGFCFYGKAPECSRERFILDCTMILSRITSALDEE